MNLFDEHHQHRVANYFYAIKKDGRLDAVHCRLAFLHPGRPISDILAIDEIAMLMAATGQAKALLDSAALTTVFGVDDPDGAIPALLDKIIQLQFHNLFDILPTQIGVVAGLNKQERALTEKICFSIVASFRMTCPGVDFEHPIFRVFTYTYYNPEPDTSWKRTKPFERP